MVESPSNPDQRAATPYKLDLLLGIISVCIPLGWSVSGLPPNIELACGCWAITLAVCLHYFWVWSRNTGKPKAFRWLVVIVLPILTVAFTWKPIVNQYRKEHPVSTELKLDDLTATITFIDPQTGETDISFQNAGLHDVAVLSLDLTLTPPNPINFAPIPANAWASFTNAPFTILNGGGFAFMKPAHVGFILATNKLVFIMELLHSKLVVRKGESIYTNLSPIADTLRNAGHILVDNTPFELGLRIESIDSSNHYQNAEFKCGTYSVSSGNSPADLIYASNCPCLFQILPSPTKSGSVHRIKTVNIIGNRWATLKESNMPIVSNMYFLYPPMALPMLIYYAGDSNSSSRQSTELLFPNPKE